MRFVGSYGDHELLKLDARAYEDVLIYMAAESKARRIQELRRKRQQFGEASDLQPVYTWKNGEEPVAVNG